MLARYDPMSGLSLAMAPYEGEISRKLVQLIIKELDKHEQDSGDFREILILIGDYSVRRQ